MPDPRDPPNTDPWADLIDDVWRRYVDYRHEDRGQRLAADIDEFRGSLISSEGSRRRITTPDLRNDAAARTRLLIFARDTIPAFQQFEAAIRRQIVDGRFPPSPIPNSAAPPTEDDLLALLAAEDALWRTLERLTTDAAEASLRAAGVPVDVAAQVRHYTGLLLPHK